MKLRCQRCGLWGSQPSRCMSRSESRTFAGVADDGVDPLQLGDRVEHLEGRPERGVAGARRRDDVFEGQVVRHPPGLVVVEQAAVGRAGGVIAWVERHQFRQRQQLGPGPQADRREPAADRFNDAIPPRADSLAAGFEVGDLRGGQNHT